MATSSGTAIVHIKELLGDTNPAEPMMSDYRYEAVVFRNVSLIAARCQMPNSAVTSVSLVAGTYEYTLTATTAQSVGLVLLNSTGDDLVPVPWEQFNAYYKQDTNVPRSSGTPREYAMREDAAAVSVAATLRLRFGPTPNATDTAKVHLAVIPALDSGTIPFSDDLIRGLESLCAAEIVLMISPDRLAAIGLAKDAASKWTAEADRVVHDYNVRQGRLGSRQDSILRYGGRRVSSGQAVFWGR